MTRERAIEVLELEWHNHESGSLVESAIDMAIAALREQEERKPCKWCEDLDLVYDIVCYLPHDNGSATDIPIKFCPMCGRRLEEV